MSHSSVRAYRTLLWLYPPSFRREYGDHMVAVFEDMLRDGEAPRVWWRVVVDASTSIPIQHTEAVMATRLSPNIVGLLAVLFFAIGMAGIAIGGVGHWWFTLPALGSLAASAASLLYWHSHWQYVEERALHHHWYAFILGGGALLGSLVIGTGLDLSAPWELLVAVFLGGWALLIVGVLLGLWNGFVALRRRGDNGVWPAS